MLLLLLRWRIQLLSVSSWVLFFISSRIFCRSTSTFDCPFLLLFSSSSAASATPGPITVAGLREAVKERLGGLRLRTHLYSACARRPAVASTWTLTCGKNGKRQRNRFLPGIFPLTADTSAALTDL